MKSNSLKPIEVGYGNERVIIFPRMCSVSEQEEFDLRFTEIGAGSEKHAQEFALCKAILAEISLEVPQKSVKEITGWKKSPLVENAETPAEAINVYFAEMSMESERIVRTLYRLYTSSLQPDASFL
jgi:hypothetical protein